MLVPLSRNRHLLNDAFDYLFYEPINCGLCAEITMEYRIIIMRDVVLQEEAFLKVILNIFSFTLDFVQ